MSPLRRKFSLGLTVLAWLFASGSPWDIVQVFAWARMFSENAQTLPFTQAFSRTFSPEARCDLCVAVTTAKQQQDDPALPASKFETKVLLVLQPTPPVTLEEPQFERWPTATRPMLSAGRNQPPVPPPRA